VAITLGEWLEGEPFALGMSSGFFGFFAHTGMLEALVEAGLRPAHVAGSSAGALVAGAWAAGIEPSDLAGELLALERRDFWDPAPGPGLLRGRLFRRRLEALLPTDRIEDCRVPLSVSVYDLARRRTRVLERGALAPSLHASCAVPLMFRPVRHAGGILVDGGVADRPGLAGLRDAPRVLHHHLPSRRSWPRAGRFRPSPRSGLVVHQIDGLPRVDPFRLADGGRAREVARAATRAALERPAST
jgi:NTE family protein